jgi:hypothetical protein
MDSSILVPFLYQDTLGTGLPDRQQMSLTPMPDWIILGRNKKVKVGFKSASRHKSKVISCAKRLCLGVDSCSCTTGSRKS